MMAGKITQAQLNDLMEAQWVLYQKQAAYNIANECKPTMDAAQKVMRDLAEGSSSDPLHEFFLRSDVGENAAWNLCTDAERTAGIAKWGQPAVDERFAFYSGGGSGGMNVREIVDAASPSGYSFWSFENGEQLLHDVNKAADAYIGRLAASQGRVVPAPLPR
jgi:hypothetical protein